MRIAEDDLGRFGARIGGNRRFRIPYLRALAVLAHWRGDATLAIEHLRGAAALAEAIGLPGETWEIEAELARLFGVRGDEEQAQRHRDAARAAVQGLAATLPEGDLREAFLATQAKPDDVDAHRTPQG